MWHCCMVGWLVGCCVLLACARASLANDVQSLATYVASTKNVQVSPSETCTNGQVRVVHFWTTSGRCPFLDNTNLSNMNSTNSPVKADNVRTLSENGQRPDVVRVQNLHGTCPELGQNLLVKLVHFCTRLHTLLENP